MIRLSLLLTFAGVAAVLYVVGGGLTGTSGASGADSELSAAKITASIAQIISLASTKFLVTAAGLGLSLILVLVHYVMEMFYDRRLFLLSSELDHLLSRPDVSLLFRDSNDHSESMRRGAGRVADAIAENIKGLSKISQSFDDKLIGGIATLIADNKNNLEAVIDQLRVVVRELEEKGVKVAVHSRAAAELNSAFDILFETSANSSAKFEALLEACKDLLQSIERRLVAPEPER